jgi:hypothetical protein
MGLSSSAPKSAIEIFGDDKPLDFGRLWGKHFLEPYRVSRTFENHMGWSWNDLKSEVF